MSMLSKFVHGITGSPTSKEKRAAKNAMDTQSQYYKTATDELEKATAEINMNKDNERKRKNEKLMRTLGANRRPMMNMGASNSGMSDSGLSNITG